MRLNGGGVRHGRVEVCISEVWTTICSDYWDYEDASVACRQLGYSPYGNSKYIYLFVYSSFCLRCYTIDKLFY